MEVTAYCDGSGRGFVCAIFDYGEEYQRCYFGKIDDQVFHEYRAVLFAVEKMTPEHKYILYNDNVGTVQHLTGKEPGTAVIKHLIREIKKRTEHLDIKFRWIGRDENLAGIVLDGKSREVFTERKRKTKLNPEVEDWWHNASWFQKAWPEEEDDDRGTSNNIGRQMEEEDR